MSFKRPAYEQVVIAHGGNIITLRPSLQAACTLEARYGFPALFKALDELNYTIITEIILTSCSGSQNAAAFLSSQCGRPLSHFFNTVQKPLAELITMLTPATDPKAKPGTGKPMAWSEIYAALFTRATGWLHWSPEATWNATPTEIDRAYWAHIEQLKAIHGSNDDKHTDTNTDPEQAERNIADGLDPEFDRAGLHALKGQGKAA